MGFHSLTTTTHPPNVNLPSSGQQVTARLSARKVFVTGGGGTGPKTPWQGHYNISCHLLQFFLTAGYFNAGECQSVAAVGLFTMLLNRLAPMSSASMLLKADSTRALKTRQLRRLTKRVATPTEFSNEEIYKNSRSNLDERF